MATLTNSCGEPFFVDIPNAANIQPVHAAGIELMREVAFDSLPSLGLQPLASCSPDAPPVGVYRFFFGWFVFPVALSPFRFGDIRPQFHFGESPHNVIAVIAL